MSERVIPGDLRGLYNSAKWNDAVIQYADRVRPKSYELAPTLVSLIERIADLQAKLEEKESYICNFEHATKIERADNEAELQRLRTELETLKAQTDWEEDSARAAAMNSLEAENVRLRTENAALKRPVSDEEWLPLCRHDEDGFEFMNRNDLVRFLASRTQEAQKGATR